MSDKIDISPEAVEHLAEAMEITLATLLGIPHSTLEAQTLRALSARAAVLEERLIDVASSLAAAISLLERGGKKAAASNKMFAQMLIDYNCSLHRARAALAAFEGDKTDG